MTRILTDYKKKTTTTNNQISSASGSIVSPLRDESYKSKMFSEVSIPKDKNENLSCIVS